MTIATRKPRALVLDDQFLIAASIESCLIEIGYQATVCLSEADALAALAGEPFDVAVVDYHLAAGTSDVVIGRLEELGTPYAICSGSMAEDVLAARPDSVIIAKPFTDSDVIGAVERLVGASASIAG
jgi:CheY-like chemotaxis protein